MVALLDAGPDGIQELVVGGAGFNQGSADFDGNYRADLIGGKYYHRR